MAANPFDAVLEAIAATERRLEAKLDAMLRAQSEPEPEWETLTTAANSRHRARRTLMQAVKDGQVRAKRVPFKGGRDAWLLDRNDLDRTFPVLKK